MCRTQPEAAGGVGRVLDRFSRFLRFDFADVSSDATPYRARGVAPPGRVGVLDVVYGPTMEVSFLFSRFPGGYTDADWVDQCLIALADSVDINFLGWLRRMTVQRDWVASWEAHRRFPNGRVAIRFDPVDILVVTVHCMGGVERLWRAPAR